MAISSCLCHPLVLPLKEKPIGTRGNVGVDQRLTSAPRSMDAETFGRQITGVGADLRSQWSFVGGSRVITRPQVTKFIRHQKGFRIRASWLSGPQLASTVFTLGTAGVLPFYTLMVFAPKAELLPGIAKMFSSDITLASAWIHLLAVDLFAARHVFQDGLRNRIETRHSVSLCLLFCPIGILTHVITKALTKSS